MFQLGSKFVSKLGGKEVWTVVEIRPDSKSYVGQAPDGSKRVWAHDQMVLAPASAGHRKGTF